MLRPGQPWSSVDHEYDYWPDTFHVAAFTPRGQVVGCATFYPEPQPDRPDDDRTWRLRAMATAPQVRGQGFGAATLRYGIAEIRRRGGTHLWCNARTVALGFYQKLGFSTVGDEFEIEPIGPHYVTEIDLMPTVDVLRYTAFSTSPQGGNPAGVVLEASGLDDDTMQAIAAEVGYSETAFLTEGDGPRDFQVRYFAPSIEVPFCGHATIATAVALGERRGEGHFVLHAKAGEIEVEVTHDDQGLRATLTSVEPKLADLSADDLDAVLAALRWSRDDLDPAFTPKVSYAGAWHPVIAASTRGRLAELKYDFDRLRTLMTDMSWTTIQLIWRESPTVFHARDPFAVGGVVEDPATGAGAAALGHYLRETGQIAPPVTLTVHQGHDMGRPSLLIVDVDDGDARIRVGGHAVSMTVAT